MFESRSEIEFTAAHDIKTYTYTVLARVYLACVTCFKSVTSCGRKNGENTYRLTTMRKQNIWRKYNREGSTSIVGRVT
jgi:hypothetical protein